MTRPDDAIKEDILRPAADFAVRRKHARRFNRLSSAQLIAWTKRGAMAAAYPFYLAGFAMLSWIAICTQDLPSAETLWAPSRPVSVQIVDRYGRDIMVRGASDAPRVKMSDLPPHVSEAVLATEDRRFYHHIGVDPIGLTRAVVENFKARRYVQGGSTLTQQLTKNVFLSPEKTIKRKTQEMILSVWLEHEFTKTELLEMYLSRVYFGGGAWGAEAASKNYFGKSANELNIGEAAMLAGLLKAPSRYNPVSDTRLAADRTARVLGKMIDAGFINREEQLIALTDPIHIRPPVANRNANYFVDWIWKEMEAEIGIPSQDIVIQTTLDRNAQIAAQASVLAHLDPEKNAGQAAVVTIDGTGGVQAMVGGASYGESQFNRATDALRQPGSSFKPFVYLTAFKAGLTPWSVREDAPIKIGDWEPKNFKKEFRGPVTLERAFGLSLNTVAVRLTEEVGRERVVETASPFGFEGLQPLRSIALGAQATTPLTLTAAYLPFANWGDYVEPYGIISISTADGTPLYDKEQPVHTKLIDSQSLGYINRLMKRTVLTGTGTGAQITGRDIAGKTGTTNDFRDAWFVGFVPDMVTSVWVGADDFTPMKRVTGGSIPASIWHDYMEAALEGRETGLLPIAQQPVSERKDKSLDVLLKDIEAALP